MSAAAVLCVAVVAGWPRIALCASLAKAAPVRVAAGMRGRLRAAPGLRDLRFERNEGQTDGRVHYLAHGQGYSLFLTEDEAVLALRRASGGNARRGLGSIEQSVVRLKLAGANPKAQVRGERELPGKSNYFIGRNPANWRTNVPTYARVRYAGAYRGIDVVYYGRQGQLEYDFRVAPGANPSQVRIGIRGAKVRLNGAGALVLETKTGEVELHPPAAYQWSGGRKRAVEARYVWRAEDEVGLEVTRYQRSEPLIIDPVLTYSTYLGGSGGDIAYGIAADSSGDAYVTGTTGSINFPVVSALQSSSGGNSDAFISKLNPSGSGLIYSTYVGGSGADSGNGIAIDTAGDVYVTGTTSSADFPVTASAYQTTFGGGASNAFVLKLNPAGSALDYASYLGGSAADSGQAIAIDSSGNAYVTGSTTSSNFPVLPVVNPFQPGNAACTVVNDVKSCFSNVFVSKFNATGSTLIYSTYLGGSEADAGEAVAVDAQGDCYVAGYANSTNFPMQSPIQSSSGGGTDGFVAELNPAVTGLVFSTYLGGSGNDQVYGMALDSVGSIYVTGQTQSPNFPTTTGAYQTAYGGNGDAFVTKLSPQGALEVYSTFLGGSDQDQGNGIAVDSSGDAFVVGYTQSSDFPAVDPFQKIIGLTGAGACNNTTCSDAFITELGPSGTPDYSTYLGGSGADVAQAVAVDSSGFPYVAGSTNSMNFPVISGASQAVYAGSGTSGNAFVVKVSPSDSPAVALTPQSINFGNQTLNQASSTQSVTLINEGSAPLRFTAPITASGPFTQTNNCGTTGATVTQGGGSCTINVTFTPTVAGPVTNEITIADNAAGSPHEITVTGDGVNGGAGALTMTPSSLIFPTLPVGRTSSFQNVEIINTSKAAVSITEFNISGQFTEVNTCGKAAPPNQVLAVPDVLNAGASCGASIFFAPTSGGAQTGSFSVTSNGSGSASVSLTGNGGSEFTLSSNTTSSTIVVGTTKTSFTISAAAPSSFTSSISLACSSGVTCSFNPSSITAGQTSTVTVQGLSATSSNPTSFTVTGTSSSQTVTLPLSVFLADYSISATPAMGQVAAGNTTTYSITVTPLNGFNQVVLFSCSGLPAQSSCTFTPPGITLNGSAAGADTLSVCTTSQLSTTNTCTPTSSFLVHFPTAPRAWPRGRRWVIPAGALLLLLGLLAGYKKSPGRFTRNYWTLAALALILLSLSLTSCNNLYYQNNISPAPEGTPSGVVTLTLRGTLGSNDAVWRTTTVNLSVSPTTN